MEVDDRALYEIYLPAFEKAVKEGDSWSLMGAYNLWHGEHCCESQELLNQILREDWRYDGAVKDGKVPEEWIDRKIRNILRLMFRIGKMDPKNRKPGAYNTFEHQKVVLDAARESVILLKNEEQMLPLDRKKTEKILVVGDNANRIHSNGGGSAEIKALYEITPLLGIKKLLGGNVQVDYVQGYDPDDLEEKTSEINWQADSLKPSEKEDNSLSRKQQVRLRQEALRREAVEKAADYDTVLLIGGQNHNQDLEGMDREDMKLPYGQDELIFELLRVNPNVIVVMISGSPVEMPWADQVKALIWQYYSGMGAEPRWRKRCSAR